MSSGLTLTEDQPHPITLGTGDKRQCTKCMTFKPATPAFFPVEEGRLRRQCRECRVTAKRLRRQLHETPKQREQRLAAARQYGKQNKEKIVEIKRRWKAANADHLADYFRQYYQANRSVVIERSSQWRRNNKERKLKNNRLWAEANPEKALTSSRLSKKRRRRDARVRLFESVSEQIRASLRGNKDGRSWEALVGFTRQELVAHLERQFTRGMSWANYGEWHIDHILPASGFSYDDAHDAEFKACWALTNLRPLWALENIAKRDNRLFLI